MLFVILIVQQFQQLVNSHGLDNLNVICKHQCQEQNVIEEGELQWDETILIDDQKEFIRFEVSNIHQNEPLNLSLQMNGSENIKNSIYLPQGFETITNLTTPIKINLIFGSCITKTVIKYNFTITEIQSNESIIIPFSKICNNNYFDPEQYDIKLYDNDQYSQWNNSNIKLIDNDLDTYFEITPSNNQTVFINNVTLIVDNNNSESIIQNIKSTSLDPIDYYVTTHKKLILNPKISCKNISDEIVNFYFNVSSKQFKQPFILKFQSKCDRLESEIENNQDFPLFIGTTKKQQEMYSAGKKQTDFNPKKKIIPENKNAFQFYIYFKGLKKKELFPTDSFFEVQIKTTIDDDEILKIKPINRFFIKSPDEYKQVLIQFECLQQGEVIVDVNLKFDYAFNLTQTTNFSFTKKCGQVKKTEHRTLLGEIFYYGICIIAILFGVQTIRLFTNLMKQETQPQEEPTIDTSYKRGYRNVEDEQQIEL